MASSKQTSHEQQQTNMHRNEEIITCQEHLRVWRQKLQMHKREWKQQYTQTSLQRLGGEAWCHLTPKEQKTKTNILIILQEHDKLPCCLCRSGFWTTTLPPQLQDDRDLLLARLRRTGFLYEFSSVFFLPDSLKGDVEVVTVAVQKYPQLLLDLENDPKAEWIWKDRQVLEALFAAKFFRKREEYLRLFSVTLRSDSDLMLEALRHGIRIFELIPKELRNSRPFALQAAAIMKRSTFQFGIKCLKVFSQRLKSDLEVVRAFCECDGSSLACASYTARRNEELVRLACMQEPTALVYCLKGSTRTRLIHDKTLWIDMLRKAEVRWDCPFSFVGDLFVVNSFIESWDRLWDMMPMDLQQDSEIALLMFEKAPSSSRFVGRLPQSLLTDHAFLIQVAALGRLQSLPVAEHLERGVIEHVTLEFCCAIVSHEAVCPDVIQSLFSSFPIFTSDRRFWEAFHPSQIDETLDFVFEEIPDEILNDKEIILKFAACEESASYVASILWETHLAEDRDVLSTLLSTLPETLTDLPNYIQELYPDLVAKCIDNTPSDSFLIDCLQDYIDEALWSNREVALAWIRKGGEDLPLLEEFYFDEDEEIFLAVAEHRWDEFHLASGSLLKNKEFLIKAVSRNGRVWTILEDETMKEDFDIALAAFAADPNLPYYSMYSSAEEEFPLLATFARKVRNELEIHDSFVQLVLCSMDLASSSSANLFAQLNQGRHTTLQYKKSIADYIGLPVGDRLVKLRSASENLALWGF